MKPGCTGGITVIRILFLVILAQPAFSQHMLIEQERPFLNYLVSNGLYSDAFVVLDGIRSKAVQSEGLRDSISLEKALLYSRTGKYDSSAAYFRSISSLSLSRYRSCINQALLNAGRYTDIPVAASSSQELKMQELSSVILTGKFSAKDTAKLGEYTPEMQAFALRSVTIEKKSPWIAGGLSAVVPGAGKWYAGRKWQGISAFASCVLLGLQSYEAYRRDGVYSARFGASIALFTVFYTGSIWGSMLDARKRPVEQFKQLEHEIIQYNNVSCAECCKMSGTGAR